MVEICGYEFEASCDEWDRLYGVDFFKKIGNFYIGIQIKPLTFGSPSIYGRYKGTLRTQHRKFTEEFGGKVFIVFNDNKGKIINSEICTEIKEEINRLSELDSH